MPHSEDAARASDVEIRLPAESAFASVLRTTAAAVAARLDFTIDDIEDLRIAVSEATSLVLPEADPGTDLVSRLTFGAGSITMEISVEAVDNPVPDLASFAWQVLDTLTEDAEVTSRSGTLAARFTLSSETARTAAGAEL